MNPGEREMVLLGSCIISTGVAKDRGYIKASCPLPRCSVSTRAQQHDRNCFANSIQYSAPQMAWPCSRILRVCNIAFPSKLARGSTRHFSLPQILLVWDLPSHLAQVTGWLVPHSQPTAEAFFALGLVLKKKNLANK